MKKCWRTSVCGAIDTPVLHFWSHVPWVSKPGWITNLHDLSPAYNGSLRFTTSVTPADPLVASAVAESISIHGLAHVLKLKSMKMQRCRSTGPSKMDYITCDVFSTLLVFLCFMSIIPSPARYFPQEEPIEPLKSTIKKQKHKTHHFIHCLNKRSLVRDRNLLTDKEGHHGQVQLKALYICHPVQLS